MKSIKTINVDNKKVLVRVDFNVPLNQDGEIKDDFRIKAHLKTIKYLKENNAKIILISHLGNPKGKEERLSLKVTADRLGDLLSSEVKFEGKPASYEKQAEELNPGEVLLLENLRFSKEEKENNADFAAEIARLADIFVQDAFSVCHRDHASVSSIPKFLKSYAGLLLEEEIEALDKIIKNIKHPLVAIIGGAKIETKTSVIENFLEKADAVLLGGLIANTVLKHKGLYGEEVVQSKSIAHLNFEDPKLIVPIDGIISKRDFSRVGGVETIKKGEEIADIGPKTTNCYKEIIKKAKTIIWNGPLGKIENDVSSKSTEEIARTINKDIYSVVGGGETIDFIHSKNLSSNFSFISSGGGAMLDYLSGKNLKGIEALKKSYEN